MPFTTDLHSFIECFRSMLQRKEEDLLKRQAIEKRALPKRIRAERKARDMMFRESLRISMSISSVHDPEAEREKLKKVSGPVNFVKKSQFFVCNSSMNKRKSGTTRNNNDLRRNT